MTWNIRYTGTRNLKLGGGEIGAMQVKASSHAAVQLESTVSLHTKPETAESYGAAQMKETTKVRADVEHVLGSTCSRYNNLISWRMCEQP